MDELTVALLQEDIIWEDHRANIDRFDKKIDTLQPVDLIVLPEMFSTGFTMVPEKNAQTMGGPTVSWLCEKAVRKNTDIVGSIVIEEDGQYFNRLVWAKPDESLFTYDKKHLFTFAGDHNHYSSGTEQLVVEGKGWRIATFICFDLRFPAWCRNLNTRYDAALFIASWPEKRRSHWQSLLQARAIENQSYVLGLNRVGTDGNDIKYSGDSCVIDPLGNSLYSSSYEESSYTCRLSKTDLQAVREQFPFLKEADAFELL